MIISNCTQEEIETALKKVSKKFGNNIIFKGFTPEGKRFRVTLKVKDSKGLGARRGITGRRMISACWHVHGHFFDALPKKAVIRSASFVVCPGDDWNDFNAGSTMAPVYMSELCGCSA